MKAARIHHASRRRGSCLAARGARAATVDTSDRFPWHYGYRFRLPGIGIP
jgi:hypothetical protein